ncbi:hypothetical protein CL618_03140 [archaeon]|nr:hypothetical protein [archaeon]|tara:strand:+ start:5124 stop:5735 length:612 start_codon:yes stop_codon:yes gene_type:complete
MKLILSGGGKGKETEEIDTLFKELVSGKVLYLPQARKEKEYNSCLNWVKQNIHKNSEIDLTIKDLEKYEGIFIGGGNTFKLLYEFKETKFFDLLKNFKGVIYGGSAGAIIFGKDIITASDADKNQVKLKDTLGFNLVKGYSIFCHYTKRDDKVIKKMIKKYNLKIIALPNSSALLIDNNITVIGNNCFIFDKEKREIKVNEEI